MCVCVMCVCVCGVCMCVCVCVCVCTVLDRCIPADNLLELFNGVLSVTSGGDSYNISDNQNNTVNTDDLGIAVK